MKPGPQGVQSLAKLGSPCQDMKTGPQGVRSLANLGSPCQDMEPGLQGLPRQAKFVSPCQDMKPGPRELAFRKKLGSPCQDMKPGPQGKLMYYYFYHGFDLREIIRFLRKIECIKFECNKFVLVLVQINLIHYENSICISST